MKQINYYVIGGQYLYTCYGGTPTLIGAKRLANKNKEYWHNWAGWKTPRIYSADDTELVEVDGYMVRVPKRDRHPIDEPLY